MRPRTPRSRIGTTRLPRRSCGTARIGWRSCRRLSSWTPKLRRGNGSKINGGRPGRPRPAGRAARRGVRPPKRGGAWNGKTNLTDPDSRIMHTRDGFRQAFNAQAVATSDQMIVAAEVVPDNFDFDAFHRCWTLPAPTWTRPGGRSDPCGRGRCRLLQQKNRTRPAEGNNPILLVAVPHLGGKKPAEGQVRKTYPGRGDDPSRGRMTKRLANPAGSRLYAPQNHHRAGVWSDETARRAADAGIAAGTRSTLSGR